MIEAIKGRGVNRAKAVCDDCAREEVVTCDYERIGAAWRPNEGQIIRKMESAKWALVKGKLRCPTCEGKRKVSVIKERKPEESTEALRQPSPKQKREIIGLLEVVYDDEAKRYRDGESDKSVADAIGGGVLWGWVAQIRDDLFGPDTRSQEIDEIKKEIKSLDVSICDMKARHKSEIDSLESRLAGIKRRLDKVAQ